VIPPRFIPLVLMALPAAAFAQPSEVFAAERQIAAQATQLMHSPAYRDKAWGAYLAGQYGLKQQGPELASQLAALRPLTDNPLRGDTAEYAVIQATLDALIRVRYQVNGADLMAFQPQWPDEVLILLALYPSANREILLSMAGQQEQDTRFAAVYNLLVALRSAGVASRLLAEVRIRHVFYVLDTAGYPAASGGGRGGSAFDSLLISPPGFPRAGVYDLVNSPEGGDVVVAPGTHPVYYRRAPAHGYTFQEIDRQEYRLQYLAELGRLPLDVVKQALTPSTIIRWAGAAAYRSEVQAATTAQAVAIKQLMKSLESAEVLTPAETAAMELNISIEPDDQRKTGSALPDMPPVSIAP